MVANPETINRRQPRKVSDAEIDRMILAGSPTQKANLIRRLLRENGGKMTVADLAKNHLGIPASRFYVSASGHNGWNQAIDLLIQSGKIEKRGQKGFRSVERGLYLL